MITKNDIIRIADVIKDLSPTDDKYKNIITTPMEIALEFADMLEQGNPNFKRQRFLEYVEGVCGPNGGLVK